MPLLGRNLHMLFQLDEVFKLGVSQRFHHFGVTSHLAHYLHEVIIELLCSEFCSFGEESL